MVGSSQKAEEGSLQHVVNEVKRLKLNFELVFIPSCLSAKTCLYSNESDVTQ